LYDTVRQIVPVVLLLVLGGGVARLLAMTLLSISELIVAVRLGALVANTIGVPGWGKDGIVTHNPWLETDIILIGARITIGQLFNIGSSLLLFVVGFLLLVS
jgi:uncharacterized membrane protein YadS